MKKFTTLLTAAGLLLLSFASVSAASPDYIRPSFSEVSPSVSARVGQPIIASMVLEKVNPIPEEARLNITVEVDSPRIEIIVDNKTETYGIKKVVYPLPSEGVKRIEIRVSGYAPKVEKLTVIKILDVKTYVRYKGEEPEYQDEGSITLTISDKEIRQTLSAIEDAQDKLVNAESKVSALRGRGINTVSLEAQIANARDLIRNAEELHERGQTDLAKSTAESASKILDNVISEVEQFGGGIAPTDIKRYLPLGAAVIIVLLIAIFLMSRREELG